MQSIGSISSDILVKLNFSGEWRVGFWVHALRYSGGRKDLFDAGEFGQAKVERNSNK
jgi:hypothetical protein